MLEVIREQFLIYGSMENYLTAGDLALIENRRGWNNGCYYGGDYGHYHPRNGMAATGIGLAAGLGGAALLGVIAIGWGINQASLSRAKGAEQATNLLAANMNQLTQLAIAEKASREAAILAERNSREGWQNYHAPSIRNYVDVQTGALAGAGALSNAQSSALAQAEANLLSNALMGNTSCAQKVSLYSAPMPCGCPATNCCNG